MLSIHALSSALLLIRLLATVGLRTSLSNSNKQFLSHLSIKGKLRCSASDPIVPDSDVGLQPYLGPTSHFDDMEAGCSIEDLGVRLCKLCTIY